MGIRNKIAQYRAWQAGVEQCTFDPEQHGVVRMHLVPPKFRLFGNAPYIVILNGYYLIPLGYSWAVLLNNFMAQVNKFHGKEISDEDITGIVKNTVKNTRRIYRGVTAEMIEADLEDMLDILFAIARGGKVDADIEKLSIREYADNMVAPHRMDLMISAMTNDKGEWQCNQRCKFCYAAGQTYAGTRELDTEEWKKAISKLREAGVPMLTFTGGEPTLRGDLVELVEYSKWFITRLNTNGAALTKELAHDLKKASLDNVQITLYSSDEKVHEALVGAEHFEDTVNGIKNAIDAGLDISVNTPLCRLNSDYLSTIKMLNELGVRFVTLSGLICTGMADKQCENYDLSEDELYEIVRTAKEFCDKNGMEMDFTSPGLINREKLEALSLGVPSCGAALSNMAIAPDGTVVPCQSWLGGAALGNILTDKFDSVWKHKKCVSLRKMSAEEALKCPFREKEAHHGR